jgi:hypothetical protein
MDSLNFHLGPPFMTLLRPVGEPPLKRRYSRFRGDSLTGGGGLWPSSTPLDTPRSTPIERFIRRQKQEEDNRPPEGKIDRGIHEQIHGQFR